MDIDSAYNKIVSTKYKYYSSYDNKPYETDIISKKEAMDALKVVLTEIFTDYQVEIATLKAKVYAYEAIIANSNFKPVLYQSVEDITKPYLPDQPKTVLLSSQEQQEEV